MNTVAKHAALFTGASTLKAGALSEVERDGLVAALKGSKKKVKLEGNSQGKVDFCATVLKDAGKDAVKTAVADCKSYVNPVAAWKAAQEA